MVVVVMMMVLVVVIGPQKTPLAAVAVPTTPLALGTSSVVSSV